MTLNEHRWNGESRFSLLEIAAQRDGNGLALQCDTATAKFYCSFIERVGKRPMTYEVGLCGPSLGSAFGTDSTSLVTSAIGPDFSGSGLLDDAL